MYFIEWSKHNFILLLVGILFTLSSEANGLSHCETVEETVIAPWGEVIHYFVFLPKGYSRERHYSTQYFLHGLGGNRYWLNDFGMCGLLDQLVDEGRNPYVIVAPEGGNTTYWANGAQNGKNMGDFLSKTLIADAQSKYSLIDLVEARQIAGISMGGTSAIREQLRQPGIWGSTVAHSPIVRTFEEATKDFPDVFGTLRDFQGLDPFSLIKIHHKKLYGKLFMDAGGGDFGFWNANN